MNRILKSFLSAVLSAVVMMAVVPGAFADTTQSEADAGADVNFKVRSDEIGHVYYDKQQQKFTVDLTNKTNKEKNISINYCVDKGEVAATGASLAPQEVKSVDITVSSGGFGFFNVRVWLTDTEGNILGDESSVRFSVANAPPEGVVNKKVGINVASTPDHINAQGRPYPNMKLAQRAGFGFVRNEHWWRYYEKQPGQYKIIWQYQEAIDAAKELGMDITPILTYQNPAYTPYEHPPKSPHILEAYAQHAVHFAKDLAEVTNEVSIWNEPNLLGFNKSGEPPEHFALMTKTVKEAFEAEGMDVFMWGPGTAWIDFPWIEKYLDAYGDDIVDGIDIHRYTLKGPPEQGGIISNVAELKEFMKERGIEDKPVYVSEIGYTSVGTDGYTDDIYQAYYNTRLLILNTAYDMFDKFAYYNMNNGAIEDGKTIIFGIVKSPYDEIPYEAKPAYLAMSNHNAIMMDAEFVEMLKFDENVVAYKYKLADGRDCVTTWAIEGHSDKALRLGASEAIVCDMYGNEERLSSIDGVFALGLTEEPIYIIGNFPEFSKAENIIGIDKVEASIVKGDCAEFNLTKSISDELVIEIEASENIEFDGDKRFAADSAQVLLKGGMNGTGGETSIIRIMKGDECIYKIPLKLTFSNSLDVQIYGKPYGSNLLNRWQLEFTLKSNAYSNEQSGIMRIKSPKELADATSDIKIYPIKPGDSRVVEVNIPQSLSGEKIKVEAEIEMESGEKFELSPETTFECCVYAEEKPTIDGVVNETEWKKETRMDMEHNGIKGNQFVALSLYLGSNPGWNGKEDLDPVAYTMWDDENFYLAVVTTDNIMAYDKEEHIRYNSDGLQFALAPSKESSGMIAALEVAKMEEDELYLAASPVVANRGPEFIQDGELVISREGNVTTYEMRIPWQSMFYGAFYPTANKPMVFSIIVNDNDAEGRKGYMEYGSGIGDGSRSTAVFLDLYMMGKSLNN